MLSEYHTPSKPPQQDLQQDETSIPPDETDDFLPTYPSKKKSSSKKANNAKVKSVIKADMTLSTAIMSDIKRRKEELEDDELDHISKYSVDDSRRSPALAVVSGSMSIDGVLNLMITLVVNRSRIWSKHV